MKQKNRREKKKKQTAKKCYRPLVSLEVERPKGKKMEEAKKKSNRNGDPVSGASNLFPSPALGSFFFFFFLFLSLSLSVVTFFRFPYGTRRCLTTASKSALSVRHLRFRLQKKKDVQGRTPKWPWGGGSEKSFLFYLFYFWRNIFNDARRSLMDALFFGTRLISKFKKKSRNFVAFNFYSDSNEWNCLETLNYSKLR